MRITTKANTEADAKFYPGCWSRDLSESWSEFMTRSLSWDNRNRSVSWSGSWIWSMSGVVVWIRSWDWGRK